MANTKLERIFNSLQQRKKYTDEDYVNRQEFKKNADFKPNHSEYWFFSDLYNIFGSKYVGTHYEIVQTTGSALPISDFQKLAKKNSQNVLKAPTFHVFYSDHVMSVINNYYIKQMHIEQFERTAAPDARLSRYACWKLLKQYPNMIFAQLYFMMPDVTFKQIYDTSYKFSRIYQRQELTEAEKIVNGIAHKLGVNLHKFNQDMHTIFFNVKNMDAIKSNYNIKGTIFDYMGSQSLMARQQALNRAIIKYDYGRDKTFENFMELIRKELILSRTNMINRTGRAPESDISLKTISQVMGELKKLEQTFIDRYAYQSLK